MTRILLKGGCVLTLGARSPNLRVGDVLIEDTVVAEVGVGLRARDAEQVDATDTIVMPGFVDTHRHAWTSLFRNFGDPASNGPSPADLAPARPADLGDHFRAEDVYAATLIGLLGAAEAGITTIVDWSHLGADEVLSDAALQAHTDAGVRSVFVHVPDGVQDRGGASATRQHVAHLSEAAGALTTVAFGTVLSEGTDLGRVADEWELARQLGLRIHVHGGWERSGRGVVTALAERKLLGDDVTLVHHSELDDADLDAIGSSGASVSLSPSSEMASGLGSPPIQELIDHGIRPGLGIDDERMAPGDMFAQMRATISLQHATVFDRKLAGKAGLPRLMSTRDVIRFATVDGARVAGLGRETGSLEPGKQADIILLRTDRPNIFPINDPIGAVVWGMDTSNVDRVFVAGRPLMRDGALEANVQQASDLATTAQHRVATAAGLAAAAAPGRER